MVQALWLVILTLGIFSIAYLGYSRYLTRFVGLDASAPTPAHKYRDSQEYVPAKKPVLLGHHYSSIAGGAPIIGPIFAAAIWGWIPAFLWIAIGNPILGAVHDFMSLSASVRHEGKSIGYIMGEYVGDRGKNMLLWFALLTIILVVGVFALAVAVVFDAYPSTATASLLYILLAVIFGVYLYQLNLPFVSGTAVFVAAVFVSVWVGIQFPLALFPATGGSYPAGTTVLFSNGGWLPGASLYGANVAGWTIVTVVYALIASVLPVWMLLQPRDFLSSFLLYAGVGGAFLAVIVGTLAGTAAQPLTIDIPAYNGFWGASKYGLMPLFPLLFVTIACGTVSGFHSLVSSGTTAKQLDQETDARLIGYGGMLGEGLLAITALITVAVVGATSGQDLDIALANFPKGGGLILTSVGLPRSFGAPFMALVFVSFLLTSTDTAVRLGRYMFEEIVGTPESALERTTTNRYVSASILGVAAYLLVVSGSWESIWPLFGGANQLLAALALLTATIWLASWEDKKQLLSTGGPLILMTIVTIGALLWLAFYDNLATKLLNPSWMAENSIAAVVSAVAQFALALVLVGLALGLLRIGYDGIRQARRRTAAVAVDGGSDEE